MLAIVIGSLFLSFIYSKMYQKEDIEMVWAAQGKADPILHPMFNEDGTPIVYDVDLSDWHHESTIQELDALLVKMDLFIAECAAINGPLKADDSNLSVVEYTDWVMEEAKALNFLSYRNAA